MTDWRTVHGAEKPSELDLVSSSFVVYERKDIREEEVSMDDGETKSKQWVYEEREMSKDEYALVSSSFIKDMMRSISDLEAEVALLSD